MNINEFHRVNCQRANRWHPGGIEEWSTLEWAAAMCGEAGEAANAAKKLKRIEDGILSLNKGGRNFEKLPKAQRAVIKETADTIIYGLLLMARCGCDDPAAVLADVFNSKSEECGFPERI